MITYGPELFSETTTTLAFGIAAAFLACLFSFRLHGMLGRSALTFLFTLSLYRVLVIVFLPILVNVGIPAPGTEGTWKLAYAYSLEINLANISENLSYILQENAPRLVWFLFFAFLGSLLYPRMLRRPFKALLMLIVIESVYVAFNIIQSNLAAYPIETVSVIGVFLMAFGYILGWVTAFIITKLSPQMDCILGNKKEVRPHV